MVFDTLKKVFKFNSKSRNQEIEKKRVSSINEEIDEFEKEIQEYISYSSTRKDEPIPQPMAPAMPENLAQGGGIATTPPVDQPPVQETAPAPQPSAPSTPPEPQQPVQETPQAPAPKTPQENPIETVPEES